jgi:hypothetical protein
LRSTRSFRSRPRLGHNETRLAGLLGVHPLPNIGTKRLGRERLLLASRASKSGSVAGVTWNDLPIAMALIVSSLRTTEADPVFLDTPLRRN